jgi:hypothetical protein
VPALQRSATPHRQTHNSREPWNKNHAMICRLLVRANPKKNALFGRFWVPKWDRFWDPELGPARPQKGSVFGSQKRDPMNAALLKGPREAGRQNFQTRSQKMEPKSGTQNGTHNLRAATASSVKEVHQTQYLHQIAMHQNGPEFPTA